MQRIIIILALIVILAPSGSFSQLAVYNRWWLRDLTTGEPVYLLGHGVTNLISQNHLDIVEHNRHYASFGANSLRLHLTQGALGEGAPWFRLPDGRYDLSRWNPVYWQRLREFMDDCAGRGIYPFIQLWDEPVIERGETRWKANPFRPSNNADEIPDLSDDPNGHGIEGFYNVNNKHLMAIQRAFVERVLDYTAHYGISIYSICNEYDAGAKAPAEWQDYWIEFFRDYERTHPDLVTPLLYTNTGVEKYMLAGADRFPVIDWYYLGRDFRLKHFSRDGEDVVGTAPSVLAATVAKARAMFPDHLLLNSRPTSSPDRGIKDFSNEEESRRIAWCFFMSGTHLNGFRHINTGDTTDTLPWLHTDPDCITCSDGLATERVIRSVRRFLELARPRLLGMRPEYLESPSPLFILRSPEETVAYLPEAGPVYLKGAAGFRHAWRYDPLDPASGLIPLMSGELAGDSLRSDGECVFHLMNSQTSKDN